MKTIARIGIIVLVMLTICAGYWFIVNQSSLISADHNVPTLVEGQFTERTEMASADFSAGNTQVLPDQEEHHEASTVQGFSQILTVLLKIFVISTAIILLQKFITFFSRRKQINEIKERV